MHSTRVPLISTWDVETIVIGLAAVIIGEVVFGKIFHNFALHMVAVVIGAIIYFVVIAIVLQLGLETTDLKLFSSLIVALFLALPYLKSKYFTPADKKEEMAMLKIQDIT